MNNKDMAFILRDNEFLTWLIDELDKHFHIDNIGIKDNSFYTNKIKTLYDLVAEYAKKYGFESEKSMQFSIYYVEYRGTVFFIYEGAMSYGCFKSDVNKKGLPYCIDLDDVRKSKMEDMINYDSSILMGLKNEINKLYDMGFSPEYINLIMNKMLSNNNEKVKVKKKGIK